MKNIGLCLIGLFSAIWAYGQVEEFELYPNGLIYSERTMSKLSRIVDSLDLKYKSCNFNTVFYAKSQAVGHLVTLEKGKVKEAKKDIENQISFDDFLKKYPKAMIKKDVLIIKSKFENYLHQNVVKFSHFDLESDYGFSIVSQDLSLYQKDFTNQWLVKYTAKSKYEKESITAFYFPSNFSTKPIPQKYSQMVGYSDCLIDTTTTIFKDNLEEGWVELPENWTALPEQTKDSLLDKMRSINVVGHCSMDSRPREHAIQIALLSAETNNWGVFLKSHLDIMNDRFDRVADNSYAWRERKTYIRELEELNINVSDLMLGMLFCIENPASNHYYGSCWRMGRALSEAKNREEIENKILSLISDPELDYMNRLLFYYLFKSYIFNLQDENLIKLTNEKLADAVATLPTFFSNRLKDK